MDAEKLSMEALKRPSIEDYKQVKKLDYVLVADNIRSGQNVGSLFRTADAFGADNINLIGISPLPPNKEVLKSALGATESVNWSYIKDVEEAITHFKDNKYKILVIEQTTNSVALQSFIPEQNTKYAIVLGNEVDGVSDLFIKNADLCIEIPQIGTKHSLNVAVCAGIVMWHMYNHLKPI